MNHTNFETATFAMGCFWSPDALFGSVGGVVRTRVGYAGGTTANPTYWTLADHIETVQFDYDPAQISYQDLLNIFFASHKATREPWKRQYMSAVFYHSQEQEKLVTEAKQQEEEQLGKQLFSAIYPLKAFYLAEDRHQKYKLQRQPLLLEELQEQFTTFSDFVNATTTAKINSYLYGHGNREKLLQEISSFGLSPVAQELLLQNANAPKEIRCNG
ncbi:peptide-methionine (S)-S-oxide reductase MsrA [Pontibacter harenae]|uniref:peptide-methionine (S)-S-oxide reductase MsrA n=1 Tax=Pontibacter harenae TaxID=2894083 RepID=UPI001E4D1FB8|nr:peptide-methionine (S)-S-oxide reductase MsrA [Pontibacter harenae]MCC9165393.1 peptide-methionine (S)-S-oxide reductase MsrA [Pontibacter harenae]